MIKRNIQKSTNTYIFRQSEYTTSFYMTKTGA
jgi:hypothetical protein